jgi:Kdo2-lipid IVA lauroyltransferase/acyltransferase
MYFLLTFLAILPLRILQLFGYIIAWFLYRINSSIHRVTQINIQLAYPELNDKQQKISLEKVFKVNV